MYRLRNRVLKDYGEVATNDTGFIHLIPSDNMKQFTVQIDGPECTPYATGKFLVQVIMPPDYPMDPPKISMLTKIWHPNISHAGKICVDILDVGDAW